MKYDRLLQHMAPNNDMLCCSVPPHLQSAGVAWRAGPDTWLFHQYAALGGGTFHVCLHSLCTFSAMIMVIRIRDTHLFGRLCLDEHLFGRLRHKQISLGHLAIWQLQCICQCLILNTCLLSSTLIWFCCCCETAAHGRYGARCFRSSTFSMCVVCVCVIRLSV